MFITFEGIEGAGKSTIARLLAEKLKDNGAEVVLTREPGANSLGRKLRPILLDARNADLCSLAELHLFLADRAQHLTEVVRPALEKGQIVICDRYADSTLAYQGYGRLQDCETINLLNKLSTDDFEPDLTLLLDLPVECGLKRAEMRNERGGTLVSEGRFDSESLKFHERVRRGYLLIAEMHPQRIKIVDAQADPDTVAKECLKLVSNHLPVENR